MEIAPNAATSTDQTTNASGSVSVSNPDYNITARSTVNTLTWTNATGATVNLQVEHSAFGTVTNSGAGTGNGWFEAEWSVSGGGGAGALASPLIGVSAGERQASFIDTVSVGAGRTATLTLKACVIITSGTSVTNTWRAAVSRYAAILR